MSDLYLEVNGIQYEGFESIEIKKSIAQISGEFSFFATGTKNNNPNSIYLPFKAGARCRVLANNIPIITGFIDIIEPSSNENSHNIRIQGRDKTDDLIDSNLEGNVEFKAPISLVDVIKGILQNIGNDEIKVINNVSELKNFAADEIVVAEVGENAFDFIEKYSRRRQVLLTSNGDGNIIITRGLGPKIPTSLLNVVNGKNNNIKEGMGHFDISERYHKYIVLSQGNLIFNNDASVSNSAELIDNEIRPGRTLVIETEVSSNLESVSDRVKWEMNIRRARSQSYECTVTGIFTNAENSQIWEPNKIVYLLDEFENFNAEMLIKEVNFSFSNRGTFTKLNLVNKDAYSLQAERDRIDKITNVRGDDFADYTLGE